MQISSANYLATYEIMLTNDGNQERIIVFFDYINQRIIPIGQISQEKKAFIENHLIGLEQTLPETNFELPSYIDDNINGIKQNNFSSFGLTDDIRNYKHEQNTGE